MPGRRAAVAALLSALVTGCATLPPPPGVLSGRLSVRVEAAGAQPARSVSSSFELRGDADRGQLELTSPLGSVVARARWAPGEAVLATPAGESRYADLDQLSREAFGEPLPLRALPDWLRGRPWAGAASRPTAEGFEQLGWNVGLAEQAQGRIQAHRTTPPAVTVRAVLESAG